MTNGETDEIETLLETIRPRLNDIVSIIAQAHVSGEQRVAVTSMVCGYYAGVALAVRDMEYPDEGNIEEITQVIRQAMIRQKETLACFTGVTH